MRAAEAVEPLLEALERDLREGGDWAGETLPEVFGRIGPPALPALKRFLADATKDEHARWNVATALRHVAENYPEVRAECVAALAGQLERLDARTDALNAGLVSELTDLKALDALPLIERAYAANVVDETIVGGLEDIRYDLGVGPPPSAEYRERRRRALWDKMGISRLPEPPARVADSPRARAEERRKKAKKAKKRKK